MPNDTGIHRPCRWVPAFLLLLSISAWGVSLEVLTVSGRTVFGERVGHRRGGVHRVRLGQRLPAPGVYSVIAKADGHVFRTQVEYVH